MHAKTLSILLLGLAAKLAVADLDDIPNGCQNACSSLARADDICENVTGSDDENNPRYRACICQGTNAQLAIQACEACYFVGRLRDDDDDDDSQAEREREARDNDANDLLRACNFPAGPAYNLAANSPAVTMSPATAAVTSATTVTSGTGAAQTTSTSSTTRTTVPGAAASSTTSTTAPTAAASTTTFTSTNAAGSATTGTRTTSTTVSQGAGATVGIGHMGIGAGLALFAAGLL